MSRAVGAVQTGHGIGHWAVERTGQRSRPTRWVLAAAHPSRWGREGKGSTQRRQTTVHALDALRTPPAARRSLLSPYWGDAVPIVHRTLLPPVFHALTAGNVTAPHSTVRIPSASRSTHRSTQDPAPGPSPPLTPALRCTVLQSTRSWFVGRSHVARLLRTTIPLPPLRAMGPGLGQPPLRFHVRHLTLARPSHAMLEPGAACMADIPAHSHAAHARNQFDLYLDGLSGGFIACLRISPAELLVRSFARSLARSRC